jgi:hypothetical protein
MFFQVILIHLFKVVKVVRAFRVYAFVENEVPAFFLWDKGIAAVRAAKFQGGEAAFGGREPGGADLAQDLPFGAVVFVKERLRGITAGTCEVIRDVTFRASADRADHLAVAF